MVTHPSWVSTCGPSTVANMDSLNAAKLVCRTCKKPLAFVFATTLPRFIETKCCAWRLMMPMPKTMTWAKSVAGECDLVMDKRKGF